VNDLNGPAIEAARKLDMGVFIISPNDKGGKLYEPPEKLVKLCSPLSPMQFNDLYCLGREEVHTLSCGAARPQDFDEHIAGLKDYERIQDVIPAIEKRVRTEMETLLGKEWCRSWHEGVPEYTSMPGEINAMEILRLWTFAKSLDMVGWGRMRYNLLGQGDHWFPGENAQHAKTMLSQHDLNDSPFREAILRILEEAHQLLYESPAKRLSQS
jgi:predicted aldo/keto reductase-like oxidoreductase